MRLSDRQADRRENLSVKGLGRVSSSSIEINITHKLTGGAEEDFKPVSNRVVYFVSHWSCSHVPCLILMII